MSEQIKILDVKVNKIDSQEVLDKIENFLLSDKQNYIVTLNPEMVVAAQKDNYFKKVINEADLVIPDGIGILWAIDFLENTFLSFPRRRESIITTIKRICIKVYKFLLIISKLLFFAKYRQNILRHRTHGIDLIYKICKAYFIKDRKIYLVGAGRGIAEEAAKVLSQKYGHLNIVGAEEGIRFKIPNTKYQIPNKIQISNFKSISNIQYPIFSDNAEYNKLNQELIQRINNVKPDILFVAFGAPKQEIWIYENLKKMPSVKLAIGVGGSFDFISGKTKRAPLIFQKFGLEWLWRLILEPWRIKRIYNATVKFGWMVWRK